MRIGSPFCAFVQVQRAISDAHACMAQSDASFLRAVSAVEASLNEVLRPGRNGPGDVDGVCGVPSEPLVDADIPRAL